MKKLSKMKRPDDQKDMYADGGEEDFGLDEMDMSDEMDMPDDYEEEKSEAVDHKEAMKHLDKLEEMGLDVSALREQLGDEEGKEEMGEGEEEEDYSDYNM